MASKMKKLIGAVGDAVDSLDKDGTQLASRELIVALRKSGDALPPGAAGKLLGKLRGGRYFDVAQEVADHLIRLGNEEPVVRRQYAQALVDQGQAMAALDMLSGLVRSTRPGTKEHGEALGLIGRVYKQIYMDAGEDQMCPVAKRCQTPTQRPPCSHMASNSSRKTSMPRRGDWIGIM